MFVNDRMERVIELLNAQREIDSAIRTIIKDYARGTDGFNEADMVQAIQTVKDAAEKIQEACA